MWRTYRIIGEMHRTVLCVLVLTVIFTRSHAGVKDHRTKSEMLRMMNEAVSNCGNEICDYVEDYPEEEIDRAMEMQHTLMSLVGGTVYNSSADSIVVESRNNFDELSMVQFCKVEGTRTHRPRRLRNVDKLWKLVVNTKRYEQRISVESCKEEEEGQTEDYCSEEGMTCMQNFQNLTLLTYDKGEIRFDTFTLPTNCQCTERTC